MLRVSAWSQTTNYTYVNVQLQELNINQNFKLLSTLQFYIYENINEHSSPKRVAISSINPFFITLNPLAALASHTHILDKGRKFLVLPITFTWRKSMHATYKLTSTAYACLIICSLLHYEA